MGILNNLLDKIFHSTAYAQAPPDARKPAQPAPAVPPVPSVVQQAAQKATATATAVLPEVDVTTILDGLAAKAPEKLDWRKSIVDLMKLVGMDSSLAARKELARELHYTGDTHDTATMNIWLHKQVMAKLAENGGKIPAELLVH